MWCSGRDEMIAIGGRLPIAPLPGLHLLSLPPLSIIVAGSRQCCVLAGGGGRVCINSSRQARPHDSVFCLWRSKSRLYHANSFGETNAAFQSEDLSFGRHNGPSQEIRSDPGWRGDAGHGRYRRSLDWGRSGKAGKSSEHESECRVLDRYGGDRNGRNSAKRIDSWPHSQRSVSPERKVFERRRGHDENERGMEHGRNPHWGRSENGRSSSHGYGNVARPGERMPARGGGPVRNDVWRRSVEGKGNRSIGMEGRNSGDRRRPAREGDRGGSERGSRSWPGSENRVRPEETISESRWHRRSTNGRTSEDESRSWRGNESKVRPELRSRSAHQDFRTRRTPKTLSSSSEDGLNMEYPESRSLGSQMQSGERRTFGDRYRREPHGARTFDPRQRLADSRDGDTTPGGNQRSGQGPVRSNHNYNEAYGSREGRGLTHSRIEYKRFNGSRDARGFTDNRTTYERRLVTNQEDSLNRAGGFTRGGNVGTRFERAENSVRIGNSQFGSKRTGSRFNGRDVDINRGRFERRGDTRPLLLDHGNDSAKRANHIGKSFPLRPFEHLEGGSNVIKDLEDNGNRGEEPTKRKLEALIKELSDHPFQHINKTLNNKAKWIENGEVETIARSLLTLEKPFHTFHVFKWAEKQYWFEADPELLNEVINAWCSKGLLSNAHEIFQILKRNSLIPEAASYAALIEAYLKEGGEQSVQSAWELYLEMKELGGHEASPDMRISLFSVFTAKPEDSLKWLDKADDLFRTIQSMGVAISTDMYTSLIHIHALNCNTERVVDLLQNMKASGHNLSSEVFRIVLSMWAKTGDFEKVEKFYEENIAIDRPHWKNYIVLVDAYFKGGLRARALQVLDEMVTGVGTLEHEMYEAIVCVMANAGEDELAENWLKELEAADCGNSQSAYNALMDMYFRKLQFDRAEKVFERMETEDRRPDEDSYNILIMVKLASGQLEAAEEIYEKMLKTQMLSPNQKTFCLMLEAFGKGGQLSKVMQVHQLLASQNYAVPSELRQYVKAAGCLDKTVASSNKGPRLRLEKSQREILAGVLLGGAQIESTNSGLSNAIHFELSSASRVGNTLFYHLHKEFISWSDGPPVRKPIEGMDGHHLLHFSTLTHPTFRFFTRQYKSKGKPMIPRMIHRWLSSRTLAYWYMYGGYRCSETGGIVLKASHYPVEDLLPVVRCLKSTLVKRDAGNIIRFHGNSEVSFWTIVKPFILPELVDLLQPSDDRLNNTDASWEELEGAIVDENGSSEPGDAKDEAALNSNHHHLDPAMHTSSKAEAQLSTKAPGKYQAMEVYPTRSVWGRLGDIVSL